MRPPLSAVNMDLKKGTWSPEEDQKLIAYIRRYGIWNWNEMPKAAGLLRSGKSCRLRWLNYLRSDIKHGNFTKDEEEIILNLYEKLGSRWSTMAKSLPGRTDNEIKNHFNTYLRKKHLKNKALQTEVQREHQTPKLESKEMSSSSSNNLSVFLISPKQSNCGSAMEIPSFNPVKEEIRNNGNQTKMGETNVGLFETCGELQSWREIEQQISTEEEMYRFVADNQAIYLDGQPWFEESMVCQYGPPSTAATASNSTTTEGSKRFPFSPYQSTDNFSPSSFNLGSEINNNQQTTADHMMSFNLDMEIPSFSLGKEEILNNGNQTKLGENNAGLLETCGELQSWREIGQQFSMQEEMHRLVADNQAIYSDGQLWFEESMVCQYGPPSIAATASNSTTTEGFKGIPFSSNQSTDNFSPSSFNLGSETNNQPTKADHMMSLPGSSAEQGAPQNLCWEEPLVMEDFNGEFMYPDQMRFEDSNYPFGSYCGSSGFSDFWMNP